MEASSWEYSHSELEGEQRSQVYESNELKASINAIIDELHDIFRQDLDPEPVCLTPMKLKIDIENGVQTIKERIRNSSIVNHKKNPSTSKQMQEAGVIQIDKEARFNSQVLLTQSQISIGDSALTSKTNMNLCLKDILWPIPNIEHKIKRWEKSDPRYLRHSI